jgi:L-lactate dehydrogenase complex protein LldG
LDRVHTRHPIEIDQTPLVVPPSFSREGLRQSFKNNLESVGGHCHIVKDENQAAEAVRTTIEGLAAARIAISDSPLVESMVSSATTVEIVRNADREYLFGSDVGITSAQWAIAETGTLVLESDDERHRLISLVPPVHICILRADDIRQTLGEILELISSDLSPTVTFITGASRTSDIELTLAIGVHGPRELHVILIADQES